MYIRKDRRRALKRSALMVLALVVLTPRLDLPDTRHIAALMHAAPLDQSGEG
ncbi:twin-arginine translocation signal domain-containing protein [Devosia sp. PTR5]|uniref:Twin-arginine translocation signal domain-containing protein n=1 Tax=Devosia oryzisoli TaxID=2774138 RepID=A0A927ISJ2_9HYPH|nr:twin-arginine translocation signal domain-containing protein [Devosia oryzisoli]MBD8064771.1 twin-arginine translocation signal domain-containing protein [Devosia oryzisoli]